VKSHEVDREAVTGQADRFREIDLEIVRPARQQLVRRHPVELGQAQETRHRDGALTAFVGTEHRGLEFLVGARFHVVEREPLLAPDGPQAFSDLTSVDPFHCAPKPPACNTPRGRPYH
jgi:hypothetical protein